MLVLLNLFELVHEYACEDYPRPTWTRLISRRLTGDPAQKCPFQVLSEPLADEGLKQEGRTELDQAFRLPEVGPSL